MTKIKQLFEDYFNEYVELNPMATFIGINDFNHIYPNYLSTKEIDKQRDFYMRFLEKSKEIDANKLNKKDKHQKYLYQE